MLRRPEGATVDEVASATGWQRHTVRGVFSGTLKKKLGLTLASAKEERGRVYRIGAAATRRVVRLSGDRRQYLCRAIFQYRSAAYGVGENATPVSTRSGLLRAYRAVDL